MTGRLDVLNESNFESKMMDAARAAVRTLRQRHELPRASGHVVEGQPNTSIAEYAAGHAVDLLAVGTHDRHGLDYLLGTTASAVLQTVHCDVLAVRLTGRQRPNTHVAVALPPAGDCSSIVNRALASCDVLVVRPG